MLRKPIEDYAATIEEKFKTGQAREHTYRPALDRYISSLGIKAFPLNEPKHSEHGAPDFAFIRGDLILGYAETKDIGADLDRVEKSEQMERYLGYSNLILTDYVEFRFYKNGTQYADPIRIASIVDGAITPNEKAYGELENALKDFLTSPPERIKSGKRLAEIMGGKARRIRDNVRRYMGQESEKNKELVSLYDAIRTQLVHDLTPDAFADMYAQTLVYGLFVARYDDDTPETFSRREAGDLIPASNPFLKSFFDHIAGVNFDTRLGYIVDELCEIFRVSTIKELIDEYYEGTVVEAKDQIIHFYEDFLKEYDSALRKKMGAYYTPLPVVRFIVRAVDHVLKTDFGLPDGLADTAKLPDGRHKVQVLDPAVGTGTFISAVIRIIYERLKAQGQLGRWPAYVHHDLLPRVYGFELMMAPYTIAHLKLSLAFKKTGFRYFNETRGGKTRLKIYLTNSLEQAGPPAEMFSLGFGASIAEEARQAAVIKNETPIMVVIGNPPYSVSSSNKGEWIQNLIKDYKKGLGEKKINLDDDYIKFLRLAEHFVEKNGNGIVAMITNNSFIDGITHRQMRKHLLETFDDIYILDLHGSARKKEKDDENVFSIQQGVSISIFARKSGAKKTLGGVRYAEFYGTRESKFAALDASDIQTTKWKKLDSGEPNYFFVPLDTHAGEAYDRGFKLNELMTECNSGIQSKRDKICFAFSDSELQSVLNDFLDGEPSAIRIKYSLPPDGRDWKIKWAQDDLRKGYRIEPVLYRPFDVRKTAYTGNSKGFLAYPRENTFRHFVDKDNIGLITVRQQSTFNFQHVLATKWMIESGAISLQTKEWGYIFPLYSYPKEGETLRVGEVGNIPVARVPNIEILIARKIADIIGAVWYPVVEYPTKQGDLRLTPEEIFDYMYAVLHSPSYRQKYKELLKIDFPRVPYPKDRKQFITLVALGKKLRELHLLESSKLKNPITSYHEDGSNIVEKITHKDNRVYINAEQYFGGVPEVAWNFYIGGYQPAQKWLKDRKGRALTNEDIEHYQKIIVALVETDRIMKEIDTVWKLQSEL